MTLHSEYILNKLKKNHHCGKAFVKSIVCIIKHLRIIQRNLPRYNDLEIFYATDLIYKLVKMIMFRGDIDMGTAHWAVIQ